MEGCFSEMASQGPTRRPRWGHRRGKKSAFLGYQKRLWLQWEAKWAKMAFSAVFACHVKYAVHDRNAIVALQEKHEKTLGKWAFLWSRQCGSQPCDTLKRYLKDFWSHQWAQIPISRESFFFLFAKNRLFYRYFWHVGFCMTHSTPFMVLMKVWCDV